MEARGRIMKGRIRGRGRAGAALRVPSRPLATVTGFGLVRVPYQRLGLGLSSTLATGWMMVWLMAVAGV